MQQIRCTISVFQAFKQAAKQKVIEVLLFFVNSSLLPLYENSVCSKFLTEQCLEMPSLKITINVDDERSVFSSGAAMQVFEKGNFAGLEEMKRNERLFNRVAPMGVNDIIMAVQYKHVAAEPLRVPIVAFDGLDDYTIDRGNMDFWEGYTCAAFKLVPLQGDHYFVSSHYRKVTFQFLLR